MKDDFCQAKYQADIMQPPRTSLEKGKDRLGKVPGTVAMSAETASHLDGDEVVALTSSALGAGSHGDDCRPGARGTTLEGGAANAVPCALVGAGSAGGVATASRTTVASALRRSRNGCLGFGGSGAGRDDKSSGLDGSSSRSAAGRDSDENTAGKGDRLGRGGSSRSNNRGLRGSARGGGDVATAVATTTTSASGAVTDRGLLGATIVDDIGAGVGEDDVSHLDGLASGVDAGEVGEEDRRTS